MDNGKNQAKDEKEKQKETNQSKSHFAEFNKEVPKRVFEIFLNTWMSCRDAAQEYAVRNYEMYWTSHKGRLQSKKDRKLCESIHPAYLSLGFPFSSNLPPITRRKMEDKIAAISSNRHVNKYLDKFDKLGWIEKREVPKNTVRRPRGRQEHKYHYTPEQYRINLAKVLVTMFRTDTGREERALLREFFEDERIRKIIVENHARALRSDTVSFYGFLESVQTNISLIAGLVPLVDKQVFITNNSQLPKDATDARYFVTKVIDVCLKSDKLRDRLAYVLHFPDNNFTQKSIYELAAMLK